MSASHRARRRARSTLQTGAISQSGQALRRLLRDRSGNVVILAGFLFPVIIGGMGLGVEVGYWHFNQRKLQHAADMAAYGAGVRKKAGDNKQALEKVAAHIAGESGFDGEDGTVTVNHPPESGAFAGDSDAVEVILDETVPRAFSGLFLDSDLTLSGRAVVSVTNTNPACVLALSPDEPAAVDLGGNTNVSLSGCHIAANSTASNAFSQRGNASLSIDCIHTVGGAVTTTKTNMTECDDPDEGISPVADPYADLEEPPMGACVAGLWEPGVQWALRPDAPTDVTVTAAIGGWPPRLPPAALAHRHFRLAHHKPGHGGGGGGGDGGGGGGGAETYDEGRYCGGLDLKGDVFLNEGIYIIDGGTLKINATANVVGTGITFFLTNGADVQINGSASVDLTAPTSGDYSGVLFFADRDFPGTEFKANGNSSGVYQGAIYFPTGDIHFAGTGAGLSKCVQLIADTVKFTGTSDFTSDCKDAGVREASVGGGLKIVE